MSTLPIKRSKALVALSKEHHFDLLLAWKLRRGIKAGVSASRMGAYVNYLNEQLIAPHFRDEEILLYDRLPKNDKMCSRALKDHQRLRELIALVTKADNQDLNPFTELSDLIEDHVRYEERELFPYIEQQLPAGDLSEAEKKLDERHKGFREVWEDVFWEKTKTN